MIASLWVYRLVRVRGTKFIPELLAGPIDPASLTNEAHLKSYGPGMLRVIARRADGPLLGEAFEVRIPDDRGRVPLDQNEFDGDDDAPTGDEASQLRKLLAEERDHMKAMIQAERDLNASNMSTFSAIIDKMNESNASVVERILSAQRPAEASPVPPWMRDELRDVKRELAKTQSALRDRDMAFFKLETRKNAPKSDGGEDDMFAMMKKYGPIFDYLKGFLSEENKPSSSAPAGGIPATDANSVVIGGEAIPSIALLRQVQTQNGAASIADVLSDHALASFRRLHAQGMLPPAYCEALGSVLTQG